MSECVQTGQPLISIVVPVYCVQTYLQDCIESLLRQSYRRTELILVNDGSTDGSGAICDWYAQRHEQVCVIHQKNRGVSAARNAGTALASGDYIAFVDADDTVEEKYLENLVLSALRYRAEIAVCGCKLSGGRSVRLLTGREAVRTLLYQKSFDTAPWGKLFRRELASEVPFPEDMFFEDLAVVCRIMGKAARVVCIADNGYCYRITSNGTMHGGNIPRLLDELRAADMMARYVEQDFPELRAAAENRRFSAYCQVLLKLPRGEYAEQRADVWRTLKQLRKQVLLDTNARYKNRAAALVSYFGMDAMQLLWSFRKNRLNRMF